MKIKTILAILIIFAFVTLVIACTAINDDVSNNTDPNSSLNSSDNPAENATYSIVPEEQTSQHWKMTYRECQTKEKLDVFTKAEDGTEFVVVFFEIENISNETQVFSIINESFYVDGFKSAQTLYGGMIDGALPLTTCPVEPGRKAKGYFLFQLSPDWKEIEIIYNELFIQTDTNEALKFKLTKNAN